VSGHWQLRRLAVCASTERELEGWLRRQPPPAPGQPDANRWRRLVVARRQRFGRGQRGRVWQSPPGGLWLSAAFPWPSDPANCAPVPLALALALALELEGLGRPSRPLPVAIKWPNDLQVSGRKLAGLLPRLRLRQGRVRWAQLGLGLNGINRVPPGAVALAEALQPAAPTARRSFHPRATPRALELLARRAIDRAISLADQPESVRQAAEQRLWQPPDGLVRNGVSWRIAGLELDGGLRVLDRRGHPTVWRRDFD